MANALVEKTRNELAAAKKRPKNAMLDFTRGALMGVTTDALGYPVDLATMALRPFGYNVEQPVGGSDWLAQHLTSPTGSIAETAGRTMTGMLTPGPEDMLRMMGVLKPKAPVNELITYHGSPHRINNVDEANPLGKFDLSKVGTGQGEQLFGDGIYLSASRKTADIFRDWNSEAIGKDVRGRPELMEAARKAYEAAPIHRVVRDNGMPNHVKVPFDELSDVELGLTASKAGVGGYLYTVDLPDNVIREMMDWDKPLSAQPKVLKKLRAAGYAAADEPNISGGQFYRKLTDEFGGSADEVSAQLLSDGIPGIKYRETKRGRDFNVFDPSLAKILKRE